MAILSSLGRYLSKLKMNTLFPAIPTNMASHDLLSSLLLSLLSARDIELIPTEVYTELGLSSTGFQNKEGSLIISHAGVAAVYTAAKAGGERGEGGEGGYASLVALAVISGEVSTVWNAMRKTFTIDRIDTDLAVNGLVLKLHKKASCAWRYREFLLSQPHTFSYEREVQLLGSIIATKSHHYFAWQHRLFLLRTLLSPTETQTDFQSVLQYCEGHLTDSSAFHYLRIVAKAAGREAEAWTSIQHLSQVYFSPSGLYSNQEPYGLETSSLLLSAIPAPTVEGEGYLKEFYESQVGMGRKPPVWLLGTHRAN